MRNESLPLNVRLLAVLVVLGAASVVGVFFLHRYQQQRHAQFFLQQAQEARAGVKELKTPTEQLEQVKTARKNYDRYTALVPDDLDARAECALMQVDFAKVLAEAGMTDDASSIFSSGLGQLETVLREAPDRLELRRRLVDALFGLGQCAETIGHISYLCTPPANAEALREFLDREGLWDRLGATAEGGASGAERLGSLLEYDGKTVDRERLLAFLGDESWRLLRDRDLLTMYARCQVALNRPELAEKPLERAIALGPHELDAYQYLAQLLDARGRATDADYWMTEMLLANPDSFQARQARSEHRFRRSQLVPPPESETLARGALEDALDSVRKAAEQALEKADEVAPTQRAAIEGLKDAFDQVNSAAAAVSPESIPDAYVAALLEAARRTKALRDVVPQVDEELRGIRDGLVLAAQAAMAAGKEAGQPGADPLRRARQIATAAADLFPKDANAYLVLSFIEERADRPAEAIAWLRRGREQTNGSEPILWQLAARLVQAGQIDEATGIVRELEKTKASKTFIDELKAEIEMVKGNWLAAAEGFERVLPDLVKWPLASRQVNRLLAECYGKLGRTKEQRDAYLQASAADRTWLPGLLGLARLKAEAGQIEEAIEDYRLVMKLEDAPPEGWIELARLFLIQNLNRPKAERSWTDFDEALRQAETVLPGSVDAIILRAEQTLAQDKVEEAVAMLAAVAEQLRSERADLESRQQALAADAEKLDGDAKAQKLAEAQKLGADSRLKKTGLLAIMEQLIRVAQRQGNWDGAEELITKAQTELGDSPAMRLIRAGHLVSRQGKEAAPKLREFAEKTEAFAPQERLWLWRRLAPLSFTAGDDDQAALLCRRVLEAEPGSLDVYRLQFRIAARRRDVAGMQQVLDEVKRIEKTPSAFWHYGEAVRLTQLAENGKDAKLLREALEQLVQAARLEPTSGQIRLLSASLHERLGDADAAIAEFLQAVDAGVREPATIRHIAQLLASHGRFREADRMFQLLGETQGEVADDTGRQMRSVKAALGEYEDALRLAREVAKKSTDYADHIWLGQLLTVVGKQLDNTGRHEEAKQRFAEAEEALKNAVQQKADLPSPWVALIQFYSRTGRTDEAKAATAQAQAKLPAKVASSALAQCYEALGQQDKAAEQYDQALRDNPKDAAAARRAAAFFFRVNQPDKGEAQLRRIAGGEVDATPEQRAWARRALALAQFARGGANDRQAALAAIDENLKTKPDSADDQFAKAVMLASDATAERRQEAIKILEDSLAAQRNPEPETQFLLAKLFLADDRWGQCKTLMRSLLRDHGRVPRYVAGFAEMLMARDELPEAATWIKELAAVAPGALNTIRIRAEYAFRERQYESLIALMKEWIDSAAATDTNREQRLQLAAGLLEAFAARLRQTDQASVAGLLSKEARSVYQQFVDLKPDRKLLMAEFLAQQGRLDEAIAILEKEWPAATPPQIGKAAFTMLDGTNATAEQIVRVDKILSEASRTHDGSVDLRVTQAVVREHQDRLDEAEAIYRDILKKDANNPSALNNLAVLLAIREVKLDEASALIDRAIQKLGPTPSLLDTRAMIQLALGKPEKALEDLRLAIGQSPSPVRLFHLAQAYQRVGRKKPAVDSFRQAHELGLTEERLPSAERRAYRRLKVALQ